MNPTRHRMGFTLLELVIVVSLLGVFVTLVFPALGKMRERAEKVVCMGNLRSLHVSLSTYLVDHKYWPQIPEEIASTPPDGIRDLVEKFWVDTLEPYGATTRAWTCPSIKREHTEDPSKFLEYPKIHYIPSEFDDLPMTPRNTPAMPWLIEIGSLHGGGNLLIRTDGGIRELFELLKEIQSTDSGISIHQVQ